MTAAEEPRPPGVRRASLPETLGADGLDEPVDDATTISSRRRATDGFAEVDDATALSLRRAVDGAEPEPVEPIDDATSISVRRRSADVPADDPVDDATSISVRRRYADQPGGADTDADDETSLSTRRRAALDELAHDTIVVDSPPPLPQPVDDETAPSGRHAARRADRAARPDPGSDALDDVTALSHRGAPSSAETRPELEDTILRPAARSSATAAGLQPAATRPAQPSRDAHVPDAAALRVPVPPRGVPPVVAVRAAPQRPPSGHARDEVAPDHESVEHAVRVRDRRRVLVVVLSATAIALVSAVALVLLLT